MENNTEEFEVFNLGDEGWSKNRIPLALEYPLTIILNGEELVTLLCTPKEMDYLAVGYLTSEGFISSKEQIKSIMVDDVRGVVRVETTGANQASQDVIYKRIITSGCGRGASFYSGADIGELRVTSKMQVTAEELLDLMILFQRRSDMYRSTHGVHSAAICDNKKIITASDDIGRHNAVDRVFGRCLLEGVPTSDKIVLTTGRLTSEILHKVAKGNVPILVSIQVPTSLGVKIAETLGITLLGDVRGKRRMTIYANDWRVIR